MKAGRIFTIKKQNAVLSMNVGGDEAIKLELIHSNLSHFTLLKNVRLPCLCGEMCVVCPHVIYCEDVCMTSVKNNHRRRSYQTR